MMSYEVMVAAVSGDPVAMQKVLAYFDGYMDQLCTPSSMSLGASSTGSIP